MESDSQESAIQGAWLNANSLVPSYVEQLKVKLYVHVFLTDCCKGDHGHVQF
jgi:hypothetical protein